MERKEVLGKKIHRVSLLYRRLFDGVIAAESREMEENLTGRNFWVLEYLAMNRGRDVFQKDLEETLKIRPSTVSKMVELMAQKNLLTRETVNGDARLKRLCLTPRAEALVAAISAGAGKMNDRVEAEFSSEDYGRLSELLDRLAAILERQEETIGEERNRNEC